MKMYFPSIYLFTSLISFSNSNQQLKQDRLRPTIVEMERKIQRRPVKLVVATEIETLVESVRRRILARLESLQFKMAFKQGSAES